MTQGPGRRRNGKVDRLPAQLRDSVDQMLLSGISYREIVEYLEAEGITLSRQAVCNYARKFLASTQMLKIARENFQVFTEQIEKYPETDTTEAIVHIMSNNLVRTLSNATPEDWAKVDMDKLLREANSLVRATAHKRRVDAQNSTEQEKAWDVMKETLFVALRKEQPELFDKLSAFISAQKELGELGE